MDLSVAVVTRSADLPVPVDEAWASLADADGLSSWLGDIVELDEVTAGVSGPEVEGATVRRLVVTEVEAGRSIEFVWWNESAPEEAAVVTIALTPTGDGDATTVSVSERIAGRSVASTSHATVGDLGGDEAGWDRRLQALVGSCALTDALV